MSLPYPCLEQLCVTLVATLPAGRPEDEALACLRILAGALSAQPKLRALNLSDNALGEKGVRAFAAGLSNQVSGHSAILGLLKEVIW